MTEVENREARDVVKDAADLYWLVFLLTGRRDVSIDVAADTVLLQDNANPFFASWMRSWARRIAIAKALTRIREELKESARRTKSARFRKSAVAPGNWSLAADTNKARIEEALLAMDVFPRAAVLLSIFEGVRVADAATLLDEDVLLVRKAVAIGLREFTAKLATNARPLIPRCPRALAWAQPFR